MKIFIVGGAGYIGSHMAKAAYRLGHKVVVIDNLSTGHKEAVLYGKFEFCDILDRKKLDLLFKKYTPDIVVHFGAYSIVPDSVINPYEYYYNNVSGAISLFKVMIDNNCKKLIFSSSAAIFGHPEYIPIDEKHPKNPMNPYGKSKLMIEEMLKDFDCAYDLKYISFRYFNAAGHDFEGELVERHDPETHLLPIIMQAANGQRDFINIFGTDYDTKDGTCVRDYIHVEDIVNAHLKGIEYLMKDGAKSEEFNLGNGKGFSVKEVIQKARSITGRKFRVIEQGRRDGDPSILIANSKKSEETLGFFCNYISLDEIIETLK